VIWGYSTQEIGFPPSVQESVTAANPGTENSPNRVNCGGDVGTYRLVTSDLGPGNDRARLDAEGIVARGESAPGPIPESIRARFSGGAGNDRLLGHSGRDRFEGNSGDDVIKMAGGKRDRALCGGGDDKAVVDRKDRVEGCERVIERSPG
jgi:Ca2+-binding RTX toxin-like protein